MAIRFKFRSSLNFDSLDIDGRASISVGELKSKIVHNKKLNLCHDFDLVFSDAVTGQEYHNDSFQIPSDSSVIVKRVPAGSVRLDLTRDESCVNVGLKDSNAVKTSPPVNVGMDDFGDEICPLMETWISGYDFGRDKKTQLTNDQTNIKALRCLKTSLVEYKNLEASDVNQSIPKDEVNALQTKSKPGVKESLKQEKVITAKPHEMQDAVLPSELMCSLCATYLKEAVMIPCCLHSFCKKCISSVLVEKGKCPKCSSSECKPQDLLPNISVRHAIEHFLESQALFKVSENDLNQYASDGESGIQAKEMPYAVTSNRRKVQLPHSPSATGRGSNQIIEEPGDAKLAFVSRELKLINIERHRSPHNLKLEIGSGNLVADFQGEKQPMCDEAESTIKKKKALCVSTSGRSFAETRRHKKGDRVCFICGYPDHFARDCPVASSPHPMVQTGNSMFPGALPGYIPPYWNRAPFPQVRPFMNPYGNPGMMPFNMNMVPATTFAAPPYIPSMYGGMAAYSGFARMRGMAAPAGHDAVSNLGHSNGWELQGCENRQKPRSGNLRVQSFDDDEYHRSFRKRDCCNEAQRLHDHKSYKDGRESVSHSGDSFAQRSSRRSRRNIDFGNDPKRSSSEEEDMASRSNHRNKEQHRHRERNSKRHRSRREECGSDSSQSYHHSEEKGAKERELNKQDSQRVRIWDGTKLLK